jgi:hypothetical protein
MRLACALPSMEIAIGLRALFIYQGASIVEEGTLGEQGASVVGRY